MSIRLLLVEERDGELADLGEMLARHGRVEPMRVSRAALPERIHDVQRQLDGLAVSVDHGDGRSGVDVVREVRAHAGALTLLAFGTGLGDGARAALLDAGANRVLPREGVDPEQIARALGRPITDAPDRAAAAVEHSVRTLLGLLQEVAIASRLAETVETALQAALDAVCRVTGWPVGHVWLPRSDGRLGSSGLWHLSETGRYRQFRDCTERLQFGPGQGLAGAALAERRAIWRADPAPRPRSRGGVAAQLGIRWGIALPVTDEDGVAAVLEFFSRSPRDPSVGLLDAMGHIGVQLGLTIERIQGAAERDAAERQFAALFANSPLATIQSHPDHGILRANAAAHRLLGMGDFGLAGRRLRDFVHPADRERSDTQRSALVRGLGDSYHASRRYVRTDGETRHVGVFTWADRAPDGTLRHVLTTLSDFTEQRRAERALRASEERFRGLFEHSTIGLYRTTPAGEVLLCNPALLQMLGFDSLEDMQARDLASEHFEPDYPREDFLARMEAEGVVTGLESRWRRRDGSTLHVRESARAIRGPDGAIAYFEGTVEDVSDQWHERQALEQARRDYQSLFENAHDPILIFLPEEERVVEVNPAACEVYGFAREEFIGLSLREISVEAASGRRWIDATLGSDGVVQFETRQRTKDGRELHIEVTASRFEYQGRPAILSFNRNISRRRQLELQSVQSQRMEAMGRLAGGVAHDFNNMLTVIMGTAELGKCSVTPGGETDAQLDEIIDAGRRASALTDQLLSFSRRQVVQPRVHVLDRLVEGLGAMLRRLVQEDVQLRFVCQAGRRAVRIDAGQFEQVVLNLVVNARDAVTAGGRITVATSGRRRRGERRVLSGTLAPGEYVRLSVSDDGAGMTPAVRARLFEPFFTTKPEGKGTGLGLATVYGIVKQAGGQIEVSSRPGRGTRFHVYLPAVADGEPGETPGREAVEPLKGRETVLLVEDEPAVRRALRRSLEHAGYRVEVAAHGSAAADLLADERRNYDLLLTDVVMPEMGGAALARLARSVRPGLPVLLMTGHVQDDELRAELAGETVLRKPITPVQLSAAIRRALDARV